MDHMPPSLVAARHERHARLRNLMAEALPGAAPETIERLGEVARLTTFGPGELIWRQGEPSPLTLQVWGYSAFRRTTADGRHLVSSISRPGILFGYAGIAGQPAAGDLVAITRATVALWPARLVRELLVTDPGFALSVVDAMGRYLVFITERLDGFIHQEARGRVLRVLAEHADLFIGEPPVLPRSLLPGLVGTSREMTGRVLRSLETEGVVTRVGRRGLRLLEPAALDELADGAP